MNEFVAFNQKDQLTLIFINECWYTSLYEAAEDYVELVQPTWSIDKAVLYITELPRKNWEFKYV
jgi:hypothetical protein